MNSFTIDKCNFVDSINYRNYFISDNEYTCCELSQSKWIMVHLNRQKNGFSSTKSLKREIVYTFNTQLNYKVQMDKSKAPLHRPFHGSIQFLSRWCSFVSFKSDNWISCFNILKYLLRTKFGQCWKGLIIEKGRKNGKTISGHEQTSLKSLKGKTFSLYIVTKGELIPI